MTDRGPHALKVVLAGAKGDEGDDEPYTYDLKYGINAKFPSWLSALADVLVEHTAPPSLFSDLPAEMRAWKSSIVVQNTDFANWLHATRMTGLRLTQPWGAMGLWLT